MPDQFTIGVLDRIKELTESRLRRFVKARPFVRYADVRLSVSQGSGAFCENGEEKYSGTDYSFSYGARVLAGEHLAAAGYFGLTLGKDALARFAAAPEEIDIEAVSTAVAAGDRALSAHIAEVGRHVGRALAGMVGMLNVRRIVLAGSVAGFGRPLLDPIRQEIKRRALPSLAEATTVETTTLGNDIVLLCAAALILNGELGLP